MPVLERADLEASPLADLHAIADQLGLDGFRRLRKADLIDTILGEPPSGDRSNVAEPDEDDDDGRDSDDGAGDEEREGGSATRTRRRTRARRSSARGAAGEGSRRGGARGDRGGARGDRGAPAAGTVAEGTVELLDNGSAFLRLSGDEPSDDDVYISAAQVRRCELVSGDRVSGPVRAPRRSERYPSLVRVEEINGEPADRVSEAARYDDLPVAYPSERITFEAKDATLEAIEWLTP